jgi:ABC-type multidrug transport system fused ATPase/permease subunit
MSSVSKNAKMIHGIRRAWALVRPRERRRLQLVSAYGVLIALLDTVALVLVYALINVLNKQPVTGIAGSIVNELHLSGYDRYKTALILLAITAALFIARSLLSVLGLWLTIGAANDAQADLVSRLLVGHARAPQLMRLERNSSETLRTILTSVDQVTSGVVGGSVSLVSNTAVALAVALGLFLANPLVAGAVTVYFVVIAVTWARLVRGALAQRGQRVQELQEERYRLIMQGISAAKELQLRGRSIFYAEGAVGRTRGINAAMRGAGVANGSLRYMLETSLVLGAALVVAVAGLANGSSAALPAVGLVLAGAFRLLPALNQVLFLSNMVQFSSSATGFVEEELQTFGAFASESAPQTCPATSYQFADELRLDQVTFNYPTRTEPALRDVSLVVRPGESVGIIGPTGSGKSTLLDVILGLLEPESGLTVLDGAPLAERRETWQRSIGYVPQDVYLVDDTLRANVALGWYGAEIDDDAVADAVRLAGLTDVITALPNGVGTVVGERGVRLSGGQRQRVGIARALYTRPSVLVLDEATSNLDQPTEHRIVDTLAKLQGGGLTMIIVTHRTESVRHCDRLFYLEQGAIRAVGTFAEVEQSVPEFNRPAPQTIAQAV